MSFSTESHLIQHTNFRPCTIYNTRARHTCGTLVTASRGGDFLCNYDRKPDRTGSMFVDLETKHQSAGEGSLATDDFLPSTTQLSTRKPIPRIQFTYSSLRDDYIFWNVKWSFWIMKLSLGIDSIYWNRLWDYFLFYFSFFLQKICFFFLNGWSKYALQKRKLLYTG